MKPSLDVTFMCVIAIMLVAISINMLPFWAVLAALVIRLIYADTHTVGVFLLMFGGILGSTIRFEMPFLPIYGLILNFLGLWMVKDTFKHFKYESASIQMMAIVLIYFFMAYILSPNINDIRATTKICGIIMNGVMMFFAYYTIIHSHEIKNETLTQCLFLASILFLVHNMNLLGIKPNNFFDYEYINKEQNNINNSNSGASIKIQDQEVVFFSNQYIAYAKNDTPYVIAFDDIKNQNENEVITNFLEYMITCGYWDYFEYGCDYLKKYDSDFINPYIERYANGDFTENENKVNQEINTDYMINFAQKMLEIK